jgi:YD repeat-containing protein
MARRSVRSTEIRSSTPPPYLLRAQSSGAPGRGRTSGYRPRNGVSGNPLRRRNQPDRRDGRQILTGIFRWTKSRDEAPTNGRTTGLVTRTFADSFGQTRATVAGYGTSSAATALYDHDAAGNLTKVWKPMSSTIPGDTVGYAYDKRGLLKRRSSPNEGTTRYRYHAAGSVIATRDAHRNPAFFLQGIAVKPSPRFPVPPQAAPAGGCTCRSRSTTGAPPSADARTTGCKRNN